jgi:hypothetical protein
MRLSVLKDDPGYKNFVPGKYQVYLNDRPIRLCITADEETGFVLCHGADENGNPDVNKEGTETTKITFYGKVEIKRKAQSAKRRA